MAAGSGDQGERAVTEWTSEPAHPLNPAPGVSAAVRSSQRGAHPGLPALLARRLGQAWQRPLRVAPTWWPLVQALLAGQQHLQLDLGCGTGVSTRQLSGQLPEHTLLLGIDASIARLQRTTGITIGGHAQMGERVWLLHGDQVDLVRRLAAIEGLVVTKTWLLYPNPWPKPAHLARRWPAHPVFPQLLALSAELELRCNWLPYAEDFVLACRWFGRTADLHPLPRDGEPLTPFERKYRASGHDLWRVIA